MEGRWTAFFGQDRVAAMLQIERGPVTSETVAARYQVGELTPAPDGFLRASV